MANVIEIIAERVRYWSDRNHPGYHGTFDEGRSNMRVEFMDLHYHGEIKPYEYRPLSLQSSHYENGGSVANKEVFAVNRKTSNTFSYTFKESAGAKLNVKVPIPVIGDSALDINLSFETTQTQTRANETTWTYSTDINVPPKTVTDATFLVHEGHYNIAFTANVRVRGRVIINYGRVLWGGEIDDIINEGGWDPATFDYALEGVFSAVSGNRFDVVVKEHALADASGASPRTAILDSNIFLGDDPFFHAE